MNSRNLYIYAPCLGTLPCVWFHIFASVVLYLSALRQPSPTHYCNHMISFVCFPKCFSLFSFPHLWLVWQYITSVEAIMCKSTRKQTHELHTLYMEIIEDEIWERKCVSDGECVCACVRACAACMRVCVCVCVRACVHVCVCVSEWEWGCVFCLRMCVFSVLCFLSTKIL